MTAPATEGLDPVELLRALVRFDTSNPPGNERECLEYVAGVLHESGIESRFVGRDSARPNLIARVLGRRDAPPLLLFGHVDVVPANANEWTRPPFAAEVVDGEIWGRGTLDMKGGVAMLVSSIVRTVAERVEPAGDLILALSPDEERGSTVGARCLVEEHAAEFDGVRYGLSEFGGFTQWTGGRPLYPIQVAEKQRCLVRATIRGEGGHPSTVVRGTAAAKLGQFLSVLEKKRLPVHVTPVVRSMVEAMASGLPTYERLALRPALVPRLTDRLLDVFGKDGDALDPLLHNMATPTVIRGGESTNVVPTVFEVDLDGRVLPGQTPQDLVRELESMAGLLASFEVVDEEPAANAEPDLALLPILAEILREREPTGTPFPMLLPGYTDARYFSQLGIQTYGFLPMKLPKHITTALIHAPDERVPMAAVEFGAKCVFEAIRRYRV